VADDDGMIAFCSYFSKDISLSPVQWLQLKPLVHSQFIVFFTWKGLFRCFRLFGFLSKDMFRVHIQGTTIDFHRLSGGQLRTESK
jgi:hypothetical protein